ncbi:MAG: hypothetical protein CMLOHMNK_02040 [Steroidobacteraceae bacterium]|nr:hypothetical protein [Steroidobacteraceae bacterium]
MTHEEASIAWVGKRTRGQTARFPERLAEGVRTDDLADLDLQTTYTPRFDTDAAGPASLSVSVWVDQASTLVFEASPDGRLWQRVKTLAAHPANTRTTQTFGEQAKAWRVGIYPQVAGASARVLWRRLSGRRL